MKLFTGLVSITFRNLSPRDLVELVARAGMDGFEWGGDVHVPHGDENRAKEVRTLTEQAGLKTACYGSYYHLGLKDTDRKTPFGDNPDFHSVLDTALCLGAPMIRVWAGKIASKNATEEDRQCVISDTFRCADLCRGTGVQLAFEYHGNTLTDTIESGRALVEATRHPQVTTLWQPPNCQPKDHCLASLESVVDTVSNVHVFHWLCRSGQIDRRPLNEGEDRWLDYLQRLQKTGRDRWALIEFVSGGKPEQFLEDAATLKRWIEKLEEWVSSPNSHDDC